MDALPTEVKMASPPLEEGLQFGLHPLRGRPWVCESQGFCSIQWVQAAKRKLWRMIWLRYLNVTAGILCYGDCCSNRPSTSCWTRLTESPEDEHLIGLKHDKFQRKIRCWRWEQLTAGAASREVHESAMASSFSTKQLSERFAQVQTLLRNGYWVCPPQMPLSLRAASWTQSDWSHEYTD